VESSCKLGNEPSGSIKMLEFYRVAAQLVASRAVLSSTELVSYITIQKSNVSTIITVNTSKRMLEGVKKVKSLALLSTIPLRCMWSGSSSRSKYKIHLFHVPPESFQSYIFSWTLYNQAIEQLLHNLQKKGHALA
jgi:hypothetical protein